MQLKNFRPRRPARPFASPLLILALLAGPAAVQAAVVVDTGPSNRSPINAFAFDSTDAYAGRVSFADAAQIASIEADVLGGSAGETFTVALYADGANRLPGSLLYSATATFASDGWNGAYDLYNWRVASGAYWVGLEVGPLDTLGNSGSVTGALLGRDVPRPLAATAFDIGSGYAASRQPLDFALRVTTVSAVPEPSAALLLAGGLGLLVATVRARRAA